MATHFFIRLGEYMMEVTQKNYKKHYKARRRQKYLCECVEENGDVSFDALTNAEFNGEDVLLDRSEDVADRIELAMMTDKLNQCLPLLSEKELELIHALYYRRLSERELSAETGVPQKTINDRKARILKKLKKFLEN